MNLTPDEVLTLSIIGMILCMVIGTVKDSIAFWGLAIALMVNSALYLMPYTS